ncbi:TPA: hypothetical protein HA241_05545 [Candidatus Woesearchaeota archaeon]|nr:hypothetical protein [Candidatus Woesearchaeota archaeon]
MNDYLFEAREELKRLEHIIYVSLKYTRTVDVILNALHRMISTMEFIIEAFLIQKVEQGEMTALPKSPALKATTLAGLCPDEAQLQKYLTFYAYLKTILKLPYTKREEYRRHVTFVVQLENSTSEIDIDTLTNCEKIVHQFLTYAYEKVAGVKEE